MSKVIRIGGVVLFFIGIIILINVIIKTIDNFTHESNCIEVLGIVLAEDFIQFNEQDSYVYTISYKVNGLAYNIKTQNNSSIKKYVIGEFIPVCYDVDNPNISIINTKKEKYNFLIIGFCMSFVFLILSLVFMLKHKEVSKLFESLKGE